MLSSLPRACSSSPPAKAGACITAANSWALVCFRSPRRQEQQWPPPYGGGQLHPRSECWWRQRLL
ncbi:unnamed protein product [Ectocarpus sp. CCAP 1310/34]|nr:unnamed protein product [Ectocarpus sp. CCAP 1310/34]